MGKQGSQNGLFQKYRPRRHTSLGQVFGRLENTRRNAARVGQEKYIHPSLVLNHRFYVLAKPGKPEGRFSLILTLFTFSWLQNIYIAIPRLLLILLRCCQPLLISRAINFVEQDLAPFENRNEAFRLILFTFLIYTGMAVRQSLWRDGKNIADFDFLALQRHVCTHACTNQLSWPSGTRWAHLQR